MLAAAQELSKRKPQNHRILFVISDGRESGSRTSFADVVKVLNSQHITVFAAFSWRSGIDPGAGGALEVLTGH